MSPAISLAPAPADGCFDAGVHRFALRVYFEDTDMAGVVYHANYLKWFERARSDLLHLLGIDQRAGWEAGEGAYAVTDMQIRYAVPARLGDAVMVETHVETMRSATCRMLQRAFRGDVLLAEARVRVGFVGPDLRPRRQPAAWRAAFAAMPGMPATARTMSNATVPESGS